MSFLTAPPISASTGSAYATTAIIGAKALLNNAFGDVVTAYVAGFKALWLNPNYTPQQFCTAMDTDAGAYMITLENYYAMALALYPGVIPSPYAWAPHTFVIDGSGRVIIGA